MARTALYRFFDKSDTLLYVGITDDIQERFRSHANKKAWWPQVTRREIEWHPTREEATYAESVAIISEAPIHNVRGTGKRYPPRPVDAPTTPWWNYVMAIAGGANQSEIARRTGIQQSSVSRWRDQTPQPQSVMAFARAYNVSLVGAYVGAGILLPEEVQTVRAPRPVDQLSSRELVEMLADITAELRRRISD